MVALSSGEPGRVGAGQPDNAFVPDRADIELLGARAVGEERYRTIVQSRSEARTIWPMPTMVR
jgi:hypothetical protein